uniref:Uncharacterized protein n=1 Tax=Micrurus lemniscatus lemniscatus TaxID=129467 RepID=A0A2D4JCT5_MICLE
MRLLGGCASSDNEKPTLTQLWHDRMALGFGPSGSGDLSCLSLNGMAFSQTELGHKVGVYRNLQLFLYEEVVTLGGGALIHLLDQLCPFLAWEALLTVTDALVTSHTAMCFTASYS